MTDKLTVLDEKAIAKIKGDLQSHELNWLKVGSILLYRDDGFRRVERIIIKQEERWAKPDDSKDSKRVKVDVTYVRLSDYEGDNKWEAETSDDKKYSNWHTTSLDDIKSYYNLVDTSDLEEYIKKVASSALEDEPEPEETPISDSTEIGFRLGKDDLMNLKNKALVRIMAIQAKAKTLSYIMQCKRNELSKIKEGFQKQLKVINRTIGGIELYLGVGEDVAHLIRGEKAPANQPINIRQMLLYMDEEVAEWRNGGLDCESIEVFDEWIKKDRNFEKLLPENKGVVGIRVRRTRKDYGDSRGNLGKAMANAFKNEANMNCYFLIRNGENVYALWTNISESFPPRLFPLKAEFQALLEEYRDTHWESDKEKIEDKVYNYKRIYLVLKGLIERTEIFHPLADYLGEDFDIFNPESYGNFINYIYDDEAMLPDGRLRYKEWKKELNKDLKRGSRVYIGRGSPRTGGSASTKDHYGNWDPDRSNKYTYQMYDSPDPGLYTIEEGEEERSYPIYQYFKESKKGRDKDLEITKEEYDKIVELADKEKISFPPVYKKESGKREKVMEKYWYIRYNPGGEVNKGWFGRDGYHERKNNISYKIFADDSFLFNYDNLPFEDIDFYLNSRIDRPNYLEMIPTLLDLQKFREEELKWEQYFVELTMHEVKKEFRLNYKYDADVLIIIWECVEWWKRKVISTRPISKDDAKALRMIKSRVLSIIKENKQ